MVLLLIEKMFSPPLPLFTRVSPAVSAVHAYTRGPVSLSPADVCISTTVSKKSSLALRLR